MIALFSVIIAILIPLTIWLRKSYYIGPNLTIEIKTNGSSSSPIGFSNKNTPDENGVVEMRNAIQIFRLSWDLDIIIRNNSEQTAFYPKMCFSNSQLAFVRIDKLNEQEPISAKEKVVIRAVYQELEEAKGADRKNTSKLPDVINELEILLECQNASKKSFYTWYKNVDHNNNSLKIKPKKFLLK